jgi:hypothetical protein
MCSGREPRDRSLTNLMQIAALSLALVQLASLTVWGLQHHDTLVLVCSVIAAVAILVAMGCRVLLDR